MDQYIDPMIGGLKVGVLGSLHHILDESNNPITNGYHSFYLKNGTLMGKIGALHEIVVYEKGKQRE